MPFKTTKKRKFVADGVFYAELNELFTRLLGVYGYTGVEVKRTPTKIDIAIRATRAENILGEKGRRLRELTSLVIARWNLPPSSVELFAENVRNRALSAIAQAEALHFKLAKGLAVRQACYGIIRNVMENQAKGIEIVISGKLRAARAKAMKFRDGYMIKTGDSVNHYVETAVRHLKLKAGVLGIKVIIMRPYDPTGRYGVNTRLADFVDIRDPAIDV